MKQGPHNEVFDPKAKLPVKKTLKVKAYMGAGWHLDFKQTHFLTCIPPDFYAKVNYPLKLLIWKSEQKGGSFCFIFCFEWCTN